MTHGTSDCKADIMDCANQAITDIGYYLGLVLMTCKASSTINFLPNIILHPQHQRCTALQDEMYRSMWENSMDEMMTKLMNVSVGGLLYVGPIQQNTMFMPRLEHLTCYLPGNLALGVAFGAVNGSKADHYMTVAKNLTYSCWQMYERMPVGRILHTIP